MDERVEKLEKAIDSCIGQGEILKQLTETLNKLSTRIEEIANKTNDIAGSSSVQIRATERTEQQTTPNHTPNARQNTREIQMNHTTNLFVPKTVKIDFPRFDGQSDPTIWLFKAEQFFQLHDIPANDCVALASFHLEGDAHLWYQLLQQEMGTISWEEFKEGMNSRYGPNQYLDFFGELTRLQQIGSVQDYQDNFEKLLAKAGPLEQARQVSCFIGGLREFICTDVRANKPQTLSFAIGLARLYEACDLASSKILSTNYEAQSDPTMPIKRLTTEEIDERRKKGLCFKCNEKFGPGHCCKKLFMIQACFNDSDAYTYL